jgi:hypothetical protein
MQDQSDNYHTFDGVEITPNLRVWSPYTMEWGTVLESNWKYKGLTDPGGEYFDGWWKIRGDTPAGSALLNGTRMAHVPPAGSGAKPDPTKVTQ